MNNKKIRIGIIGAGNCASSIIQGLYYYKNVKDTNSITSGLMHNDIGGYLISDIEVVASFDIDRRKVGKDLSEALFEQPNCTKKFCNVPILNVEVMKGPVLDGVADHMKQSFQVDNSQKELSKEEIIHILKERSTDMIINYLPVGSTKATEFYAECCLEAGVSLINNIPVFIASDTKWAERFQEKGIPVLGDDIKSELGATIIHRTLAQLFKNRGVKLERTYQLNTAGNTDFLNMLDRNRLKSKKISKTEAVQSILSEPLDDENIHIGPSDYVPFLKDNKVAYIRMEGKIFGDVDMNLELRLSVEDSPNSAGVVVDAIRCCKLALDRGVGGVLYSPSAYFMKHPPRQYTDNVAYQMVEDFINGDREN